MPRTALVSVVAILALLAATASWRLQNPPHEPWQSAWLRSGYHMLDNGRYRKARLQFRKVLTRNSANEEAIRNIGFTELLVSPGETLSKAEALKSYRSLARQYPNIPQLKVIGSILYLRAGMPERALTQLREAAIQDPEMPHLWFMTAMARRSQGNDIDTMKALHRTLELGQREIYFHQLGNQYFHAGNWQGALENYQQALEKKNSLIESKIGVLRCLVLMHRNAEAMEYGEELLDEIRKKNHKVERWLNRSMIKLIRGTEKYSVERSLTLDELITFIETELTLAKSRGKFQGMRKEHWKTRLGARVYPIIKLELAHLGL